MLNRFCRDLDPVHCVMTSPPYWKKRKYGDASAEIGWEVDVESYVDELTLLFASINLHPLGSIWVNIGDKREKGRLLQIPQRFSLAMIKRGFLLIDEVIWCKVIDEEDGSTDGNCMVEPAPRRLNGNGFENLYHFTRSLDAWSDTCAVRIPREGQRTIRYLPTSLMSTETCVEGRNLHNVWRVSAPRRSDRHFAQYPPALCERPIAMSCPMWVNPDGSLRERLVDMVAYDEGKRGKRVFGKYSSGTTETSGRQDCGKGYVAKKPVTTGWSQLQDGWTPGVVLDPFCGTCSTGEAAIKLGRKFIGIDLYPSYCTIAKKRCGDAVEYLQENNLDPTKEAR